MPTAALRHERPGSMAVTPRIPATLEDTGLSADQLSQLMLKSMFGGEVTGLALADRMKLPYAILEPLVERARVERLMEVRGASGTGTAGYRYMLTDLGRERANTFFGINTYVGPAPVPLASYTEFMHQLLKARGYIDRDRIQSGFSHLIVDPHMLE